MAKYNITVDIEEGEGPDGQTRTAEKVEKYLRLTVQQALTKAGSLINKVEVKQSAARSAGSPRAKGTAGRKPINRPKIENWIRKNIPVGPSTQGTTGLNGVDRNGRPLIDAPNRIYAHKLMAPEPEGVGLPLPSIEKVLRELDVEGYLEKGFAAGAPFYELIRPLEEDGQVGQRGRVDAEPEQGAYMMLMDSPAKPREIDFSSLSDDEINID